MCLLYKERKVEVDVEVGDGKEDVVLGGGGKLDVLVAIICHVLKRKGHSCGWVNSWGVV